MGRTILAKYCLVAMAISPLASAYFDSGKISGDIFLVRNDGAVIPAAGRFVYLIPVETDVDLFYPAFKSAYNTISAQNINEMKVVCSEASKFIGAEKSNLQSQLSKLVSRKSVPEGGCGLLKAKISSMVSSSETSYKKFQKKETEILKKIAELSTKKEEKISDVNKEYLSEKTEILKKITELQEQKEIKVQQLSSKLQDDISNSIKVAFVPEENGIIENWHLNNKTQYCIHSLEVDAYAKGVKIGEQISINIEDSEDKYGFKKNCPVSPSSSVSMYSYWNGPSVYDATTKLMVERHSMSTYGSSYSKRIWPDQIVVTNFTVSSTPVRNETDGKISYINDVIDTAKIVLSNNEFSEDFKIVNFEKALVELASDYEALNAKVSIEEDRAINKLSNSHERLVADYKASANLDELTSWFDQVELCESDSQIKLDVSNAVADLNRVSEALLSCLADNVSVEIYDGLAVLEEKFSQEFKIPGLREGLKSEFVKNVLIEIGSNDTKRDMVSIDGSYSFDDVDDGKYLLFSEYNNKFIEGFWLEPVEVSNGDHFDLNGNTFASLPFIKYLGAQTDVVCLSCGKSAFGKSMLSKSELEGGQAKSVQKETDMKNEIADSIRGLKNTMKSLQYIY